MQKTIRNILVAAIAAAPFAAMAYVTGPDPRLTGAPGDLVCTACHTGTALNGGGGAVKIILPDANTYTPGVKQHIKVEVSDPAQKRWGFQLTSRLASDLANGQAGDLVSTDNFTQVICNDGRPKPCASPTTVQFIEHTIDGTRNGTPNSAAFEFDWTPPATDVGKITLYAAGNAANGDNTNRNDHIYTTSVELAPAPVAAKPAINADGVRNAANAQAGVAPNSWITISGANLSTTTRTWTADDMASGKLPASLDSVSVTINGKPAYVEYISPSQINVLSPSDDAVGPVEVRVTSNGQTSDAAIVNLQPFAPGIFTFDGKYAATTEGENKLLDKSEQFFSAQNAVTAVKPSDVVVLYGTGFGPTDPAVAQDQLPDSAANLATSFAVTIGGVPATVSFAGLAPGLPWIYRFEIQVPDQVADGDQPIVIQIGGVSSPSGSDCCYITVQR